MIEASSVGIKHGCAYILYHDEEDNVYEMKLAYNVKCLTIRLKDSFIMFLGDGFWSFGTNRLFKVEYNRRSVTLTEVVV